MSAPAWIAAATLGLFAGCSTGGADPLNGEKLHAECLGCHGTELYEPSARKVKSMGELHKAVEHWNDRMNPKFTKQEVADLVEYLDREYYKFQ